MIHAPPATLATGSAPHYLRFARCLALVSGLTACGSAVATRPAPTTTNPTTVAVTSGSTVNRPTTIAQCDCSCGGATHEQPSCYDVGMGDCCADLVIEGPLPPPDLAV